MRIDFERYRVKIPISPKVTKLKKFNNRYYKRMMRNMRREGIRR